MADRLRRFWRFCCMWEDSLLPFLLLSDFCQLPIKLFKRTTRFASFFFENVTWFRFLDLVLILQESPSSSYACMIAIGTIPVRRYTNLTCTNPEVLTRKPSIWWTVRLIDLKSSSMEGHFHAIDGELRCNDSFFFNFNWTQVPIFRYVCILKCWNGCKQM